MVFLANENFPQPSVLILRKAGHSVSCISEQFSGISDLEVIHVAQTSGSIILTFDKDYGEIIFKHSKENPPPVVFFRFKGSSPDDAGNILLDLINNKNLKIENAFTVVEKEGIRQRSYKF